MLHHRRVRIAIIVLAAIFALSACNDEATGPRKLSPAAENRIRGQRYMLENGHRAGVVTTGSGLQYKVIKEGTGPKPGRLDTVEVHYKATFIDGREFETSRDRGERPASFTLDNVIRGWREGLMLMPAGSVYEFTVPSQLAYGLKGSPPKIGPNQTLIFTIELIEVVH
jgi:FKBP-type peptidyl-prolyl cis-trans isomerase